MLSQETLKEIARNPNFTDKELLVELTELFKDRPKAYEFLKLYGEHGELVDDLVDEIVTPELVEKESRLAHAVSNCEYWRTWQRELYLVSRLVHNQFFDSVKWESAQEEWKRRDAKALSHCGYNMLFSVILIEFGEETLMKFSLRFREHAHLRHINDKI